MGGRYWCWVYYGFLAGVEEHRRDPFLCADGDPFFPFLKMKGPRSHQLLNNLCPSLIEMEHTFDSVSIRIFLIKFKIIIITSRNSETQRSNKTRYFDSFSNHFFNLLPAKNHAQNYHNIKWNFGSFRVKKRPLNLSVERDSCFENRVKKLHHQVCQLV